MNAVFRVDYSQKIGLGHLMRCLTLANALKQYDVKSYFICRQFSDRYENLVEENGHELILLKRPVVSETSITSDIPYEDWLGVSWKIDAKETHGCFK